MINQGWKVQITNSTAMPVSGVMTVTGGTIAITGGTVSVTGDVDVLQGLAIPQHDYISLTYRNGKSYSRNGATALTAVSTVTFTANALQVGSYDSGFGSLFGTISRLTYWPERLPDATLQAITAS